jgi:hypothetical protein
MNKKRVLITLTILILVTATNFKAISAQAAPQHKAFLPLVSASGPHNAAASRPAQLPKNITDPLLLEAWQTLYGLQQPIPLWNGVTLSGRQLAQHILDHNIRVAWSTPDICPHSCTIRKLCENGQCPAGTPAPAVYITPEFQKKSPDQAQKILSTLAHEVYHSLAPFGNVEVTQLEEFVAFYVSSQIVPNTWSDFGGYDPLNPVCLRLWFNQHSLAYTSLTSYPANVLPSAKTNESTCYTRMDDQSKRIALVALPTK